MSDKTEEIRNRHKRLEDMRSSTYPDEISDSWTYFGTWAAHHDRATLLDLAERQSEENEKLRAEMQSAKADAWVEGYQDHQAMIEGIARKSSNPYR